MNQTRQQSGGGGVAVVIPCFDQARFVGEAIESALAQLPGPSEVIVVDDGSSDDPAAVAGRYPEVTLISQPNRGLAAARNSGLRAATADKVIFLDADDRLLSGAIEAGLSCFAEHSNVAFVYGGYRRAGDGRHSEQYWPASSRIDLIRWNRIGAIAAVMFERNALLAVGGFEESLGMCEDWDLYLRLSRSFPFACHESTVADYVKHASNMSADTVQLRRWIEIVRQKEKQRGLNEDEERAWQEGIKAWASLYPGPFRRLLRKLGRWST